MQKFVTSCNYNLKANNQVFLTTMEAWIVHARINCYKLLSQTKCRRFYDNNGGMNCPCTHKLLQAIKPDKMQKVLWQQWRHELSLHACIVTLSLSRFAFSSSAGLWQPSVYSEVAFWSFVVGSAYHYKPEFAKCWIVYSLMSWDK